MGTKLDLRFIVKIENRWGGDYDTFTGHVAYQSEPTNWNQSGIRNPVNRDDTAELSTLADLCISAQRSRHDDGQEWYGFALEYRNVHSVDLRRARLISKKLADIERRMARLDERFGYPRDLADYCARCADVLGVTSSRPFGKWHDSLQMDGTHYKWTDVGGLRSMVARESSNQ